MSTGTKARNRNTPTAEQSVSMALDRIQRWNATLGAFVCIDAQRALEDARYLDRMTAMGVPRGQLFGMTLGIKDVIDVAGMATRAGSLTRADQAPAEQDAPVVSMLRNAGAIILGKTASVEYAFGGWGSNETLGAPLNPWDLNTPRVPGGSSNGSGVAVAAGLVSAALGSDTGGSIRLPASFSGLVGLKTTAGLVDKTGVLPLCEALDTLGPMTRCVEDAARLFAVISGMKTINLQNGESKGAFQNMRIAIASDLGADLHPDTQRLYVETQHRLKDGGAILLQAHLPKPLAEYTTSCGVFLATESYARYGHFVEESPNRLGPAVRRRMKSGQAFTAPEFLNASWQRQQEKKRIATLFETFDALLMPTTAMPAPILGQHNEEESPAVFTRFANYFDLAAISLPVGLSATGLPVGMQIVVPGFCENRALTIAHRLEQALGGPLLCPILKQ
jgi:aspartyl-tRNA(Asn)/glutamyl-tRNA(Gln) amidotransferase subunit A